MSVSGDIRNLGPYMQGKALKNSGWKSFLPRFCTPSDIDLVFDDKANGRQLIVELKECKVADWFCMSEGQRLVYENAVNIGGGNIIAALAVWEFASGKYHKGIQCCEVDTLSDIVSYDYMIFTQAGCVTSGPVNGWRHPWSEFVKNFYDGTAY